MKILSKVKNAWTRLRELQRMPLRLEFILSDYCNLNCRGCTHYSPLAKKEFEPLEKVRQQMNHLGLVCGDAVKQVYLIGGETLLYPELPEAMEAARKAFPNQQLFVFTNGLMLPRMGNEFWESARRNSVEIAITRYPVKFDYDRAVELCRSKGVEVKVYGDRSLDASFFRFALDPAGSQNRYMSHFKCYNRGCVSVVGDYVYPCSLSACVSHLNNASGTSFEHRRGDRLPVGSITDVRQIKRLRDRPVPFCRYCKNPPAEVPYAISQRRKEEWVD